MPPFNVCHSILRRRMIIAMAAAAFLVSTTEARAGDDYLSAGELAAVGGGAASAFVLGLKVRHVDTTRTSGWIRASSFEESVSRFFGGTPALGRRNFLDSDAGSAVTPLAVSVLLAGADIGWGTTPEGKFVLQDQYLLYSGVIATKGLTDMVKGLVGRQRPLPAMFPNLAARRTVASHSFDHHSFFSGHASSSFYTCSFLNMRFRWLMRKELSAHSYRDWRWAPPLLLYGWATFVAMSRVQAYRHYITDVAVGALAGYLMAELFYSFGRHADNPDRADEPPPPLLLQVRIAI